MSRPMRPAGKPGRSGSQRRRRNRRIMAFFDREEMARVSRLIQDTGQSGSALVRNALLGTPLPRRRRPSIDHAALGVLLADLQEVAAELGKQGSNLNQLAHQANAARLSPDFVPLLQDALEAHEEQGRTLLELRDACLRALGFEHDED